MFNNDKAKMSHTPKIVSFSYEKDTICDTGGNSSFKEQLFITVKVGG